MSPMIYWGVYKVSARTELWFAGSMYHINNGRAIVDLYNKDKESLNNCWDCNHYLVTDGLDLWNIRMMLIG